MEILVLGTTLFATYALGYYFGYQEGARRGFVDAMKANARIIDRAAVRYELRQKLPKVLD